MMANEEKMEQKQEGRKHNLKVFVIMIPLLIKPFRFDCIFKRKLQREREGMRSKHVAVNISIQLGGKQHV